MTLAGKLQLLFIVVSLICCQCHYQRLEQWVINNGATLKTKIDLDKHGVRGLYAKESVAKGGYLATLPASVSLNLGKLGGDFVGPILTLLREVHTPCTRFRPYLDVLPQPGEVMNACTIPQEYLPLLQSSYWDEHVKRLQDYMQRALSGVVRQHMEYTFKEVLGNVNVTLEQVKHACALTSSRYVRTDPSGRARLLMVPVFDMMNHQHNCPNTISQYEVDNALHIIAGKDIERGDEICYSYGAMRDDYAVMHYGFLPPEQDPPRMLMIDHYAFNSSDPSKELSEERFAGTPVQMRSERDWLKVVLREVEGFADPVRKNPGQDPLYGMLMELRQRRIRALQFEIARLTSAIGA